MLIKCDNLGTNIDATNVTRGNNEARKLFNNNNNNNNNNLLT